jgi:hypothetical protein
MNCGLRKGDFIAVAVGGYVRIRGVAATATSGARTNATRRSAARFDAPTSGQVENLVTTIAGGLTDTGGDRDADLPRWWSAALGDSLRGPNRRTRTPTLSEGSRSCARHRSAEVVLNPTRLRRCRLPGESETEASRQARLRLLACRCCERLCVRSLERWGPTTDVYELHWAHLMPPMKVMNVYKKAFRLLWRTPWRNISTSLRPHVAVVRLPSVLSVALIALAVWSATSPGRAWNQALPACRDNRLLSLDARDRVGSWWCTCYLAAGRHRRRCAWRPRTLLRSSSD